MAPSDEAELVNMVATAAAYNDGPIAFRYPRGEGTGATIPESPEILEIGKGRIVREGKDIAILSLGPRLEDALKAADELEQQGIAATVADARFAKPLDEDLIKTLVQNHTALITIEEGASGGFGAHVLTFLTQNGLLDNGQCKIRTLTLPDIFQDQDTPEKQYEQAGLTANAILKTAQALL